MTAKEFVKSKFHTARSERHIQGRIKGMQKVYYLIRVRGEYMYMAEGATESKAWTNAKKSIIESEALEKKDES